MSGYAYYFSLMQPVERETYHALLIGLLNLAPSIRIPRLNSEQLSTLFFQLRLDHPEIFYAVGYSCRGSIGAESWDFLPDYMFQKSKIQEHQKALHARMERVLRPAKELKETERERYIHDFIYNT